MVTSPISVLQSQPASSDTGKQETVEAMSAKTDCGNHSRVLQDLRAVTLQEPQEDETRVDTVLGRDVQRKAFSENGISLSCRSLESLLPVALRQSLPPRRLA